MPVRRGIFVAPFDELADPRRLAALAARAEARGWDGVFLWDHVSYDAPVRAVLDPWVALAAIATATERVVLGPLVTPLARRRVQKLARETATLDLLSGGRLVLGAGLGGDRGGELSAWGEEEDPRARAALLDDGLARLDELWAGGFEPRPVVSPARPRIPVWLAARWPNRRPVARAARWDGVFPIDARARRAHRARRRAPRAAGRDARRLRRRRHEPAGDRPRALGRGRGDLVPDGLGPAAGGRGRRGGRRGRPRRRVTVLLGLDIGTGGARAVAVGEDGGLVAEATASYPLATPRPGWTEQDPADWWAAAQEVLGRVAGAVGREAVAGLGLTGQMHGSVFLGARDEVLRPALLWNDQRTAAQCAWITERVGAARLLEVAGNPALTGFQAPKVRWLLDEEPEVAARVRTVLLPKDHVRLRLTGERATDASDASGTLLLDVRARDWSDELLEALEIPRAWLPAVREGTEPAGSAARRGGGRARAAAGAAGRRGRRRQRRGGGRRRRRRRGARVLLDRHERRRLRPARRLHAGPLGPRARLLPRAPGRLPPHGRDAVGGRVPGLVARPGRRRRVLRRPRRRGGGRGAGGRGPGLPALPQRRAHAAPRPPRPRRLRGPRAAPHAGAPDARGDGGRGALAARRPGGHAGARDRGRGRPRRRRRRALPALARGSRPTSSAGRSAARRPTRGRPTARRCSAASRPASSPTRRRRPASCGCATRSRSPTRPGSAATTSCTRATPRCTRPCATRCTSSPTTRGERPSPARVTSGRRRGPYADMRLLSVNVGQPREVDWRGTRRSGPRSGSPRSPTAGGSAGSTSPATPRPTSSRTAASTAPSTSTTSPPTATGSASWAATTSCHGQFGENFTVEGLPDDEVCVGDRYRIGGALFEVTQPRVTCYKVGIRLDEPRMPALLYAHGRPGFYLRVLEEGEVGAGDAIERVAAGPEAMTVARGQRAALPARATTAPALERALRDPGAARGLAALVPGAARAARGRARTGNRGPRAAERRAAGVARAAAVPGRRRRTARRRRSRRSRSSPSTARPLPPFRPGQFLDRARAPARRAARAAAQLLAVRPRRDGAPATGISVKREPGGAVSAYLHDHVARRRRARGRRAARDVHARRPGRRRARRARSAPASARRRCWPCSRASRRRGHEPRGLVDPRRAQPRRARVRRRGAPPPRGPAGRAVARPLQPSGADRRAGPRLRRARAT